jgi:hypothetical protein
VDDQRHVGALPLERLLWKRESPDVLAIRITEAAGRDVRPVHEQFDFKRIIGADADAADPEREFRILFEPAAKR